MCRRSVRANRCQGLGGLIVAAPPAGRCAPAGRGVARGMVSCVTGSAAIASLNMVNQLGALLVATNDSYSSAFGVAGSKALVLLLMDLQHYGYLIAQLGWEPLDVGGLEQALHLEHMTLLWIRMVRINGASPHMVWAALRREA